MDIGSRQARIISPAIYGTRYGQCSSYTTWYSTGWRELDIQFNPTSPRDQIKILRKYNYERTKCGDPKSIQDYFDRVQDAIFKNGISLEDIYNFDETGFAMGLCATVEVIAGSDRYNQPYPLQPGN